MVARAAAWWHARRGSPWYVRIGSCAAQERYIELYFFHTPGRCSICKAKTENERIEALKVRMCTT